MCKLDIIGAMTLYCHHLVISSSFGKYVLALCNNGGGSSVKCMSDS